VARQLTVVQMLPALQSGGVERGTLETARHLVGCGHRAIVISAGGRLVERLVADGGEHLMWDVGRKHPASLRWVPRLRRLLIAEHVDILHLRSRLPAWLGWLAWKSLPGSRRPGLVTTVHGFYTPGLYSSIMVRGERVIAVSHAVHDYITGNYPWVPEERIRVILRGIDPRAYPHDYRPSAAWLERWHADHPGIRERFVVMLPGRLTRLKGQLDFVGVIGRLLADGVPACGLLVGGAEAGKERYRDEVLAAIDAAGLRDHILLTGHRSDLREVMSVADAVVGLSRQPESFGRTVLEALALGIPVVGYDVGGVGEQLAAFFPEGRVAPGESTAVAQRLAAWWRDSPNVKPAVLPTEVEMLERTEACYRELLADGAGAGRPS